MKKLLLYISVLAIFQGCITNDIPYPVLVPNIISLEVEGSESVVINHNNRVVTVNFPETADLRYVNITSVQFDQPMTTSSQSITGVHDMSKSSLVFTLHTYDDYVWKIEAVRNIERYFTVTGQVGSSVIDPENKRVLVSVSKNINLSCVEVTSLKLGPSDGLTTYVPALSDIVGSYLDLSEKYPVEVTMFEQSEVWNIYAETATTTVTLVNVNPWATEVYFTSSAIAGMDNGFQFRKKGEDTWIDVPDMYITSDGGTYIAHVPGLEPETTYEVIAYCGNDRTDAQEFTTTSMLQLPNSSFEYASKVAGSNYYKFYDPNCGVSEGMTMFWGSGNGEGSEGVNGSANMGVVITYIDTEEKVDGNQSVRAQTGATAGMLAAGNLFTGQFAGLVETKGGKVNFGRPWTTRPKALKLYCKYSTGKMDIIKGMPPGVSLSNADYDRAQIKIALGTWSERDYGGTPESPVLVNTTDASTFVDFYTDECTIANGELIIYNDGYSINRSEKVSDDTGQWIEYTIPIDYRDIETMPTHIIISCAASQYGDYFSGYSASTLWLDAFELIYE
ncbi:MAG: hypothetical protein E7111_05755 [Bacteroidales bacterium]|nr:hypothetical protein [Bacteroidales bacterium]